VVTAAETKSRWPRAYPFASASRPGAMHKRVDGMRPPSVCWKCPRRRACATATRAGIGRGAALRGRQTARSRDARFAAPDEAARGCGLRTRAAPKMGYDAPARVTRSAPFCGPARRTSAGWDLPSQNAVSAARGRGPARRSHVRLKRPRRRGVRPLILQRAITSLGDSWEMRVA